MLFSNFSSDWKAKYKKTAVIIRFNESIKFDSDL